MQKETIRTCTTILVGKKASLSGATIIARNEDGGDESNPQRFVVIKPETQPKTYHSVHSNIDIPLPEDPLRYTSTPDADSSAGIWAAAGINAANVAMTATETITSNARVLSADPLVSNGIGEEDITTLVLPYIDSARAGVLRLGKLLETYGTYESNGIAFSDQNEIWYFETLGGHHWAAVKIPDDAYVIAPNRLNIDNFDVNSDNTLASADLESFVQKYHLNPDQNQFNLRHIFGSSTIKDQHYNNPRAWFVHSYLDENFTGQPTDQNLPFINYPTHKISIEQIKFLLSSHYQETPFDPYVAKELTFRPIGINRNLETHILEIRPNVPAPLAGIHWLAFGPNIFNAMVPFYSNVTDTPAPYRDTTPTVDTHYMYWLSRTAALIGDANYHLYQSMEADFETNVFTETRKIQHTTDQLSTTDAAEITKVLEKANTQMAEIALNSSTALLNNMIEVGAKHMRLRFSVGD